MSISIVNWLKLVLGLRDRGQGIRESGAFLIGTGKKVKRVVFYDDLDPSVSDSGIIQFDGKGREKLERILESSKQIVLADIHTHPFSDTQQSLSDMENPMVRLKGHIAFIAPNYGHFPLFNVKSLSAYFYVGNFQWKNLDGPEFPLKIEWLWV